MFLNYSRTNCWNHQKTYGRFGKMTEKLENMTNVVFFANRIMYNLMIDG